MGDRAEDGVISTTLPEMTNKESKSQRVNENQKQKCWRAKEEMADQNELFFS